MCVLEVLQRGVKLSLNGGPNLVVIIKQPIEVVTSSDFVLKELSGDFQRIPFCVLDPGLTSRDDVHRDREDVVAQYQIAPRGNLDLGDTTDQRRERGAIQTFAAACKSFGRINCKLVSSSLEDHFLGRDSFKRAMLLNASMVMIHKGSYAGG